MRFFEWLLFQITYLKYRNICMRTFTLHCLIKVLILRTYRVVFCIAVKKLHVINAQSAENCYPMNILIFAELFCQYSIIMRAQWWVIEIRIMECADRKTRMTQQDWGKNDSFSDLYHAQWSWSQSGKQSWFGALYRFYFEFLLYCTVNRG